MLKRTVKQGWGKRQQRKAEVDKFLAQQSLDVMHPPKPAKPPRVAQTYTPNGAREMAHRVRQREGN